MSRLVASRRLTVAAAAMAAVACLTLSASPARADWHGGWHGGGGWGWHGGWGGWHGGWGWHGGRWGCCWRGGVFIGLPPVYVPPPVYYAPRYYPPPVYYPPPAYYPRAPGFVPPPY